MVSIQGHQIMDRASLRASLLLRGFKVHEYSKYNYRHKHSIAGYTEYTYAVIYPCWFIEVASVHGIKNFVSVKKAWRYINEVIQSYDQ